MIGPCREDHFPVRTDHFRSVRANDFDPDRARALKQNAVAFGPGNDPQIGSPHNWAQKSVSPTRATLIYAGEPVWAGVIGRIAGERFPPMAMVGAVLIVAAVIVSEIKTRERKPVSL